jgi:hypothetical protein
MALHRRATNGSVSTPIDALAGTYTNDGYGTISFCTRSSTEDACKDVLSAFGSLANVNSTSDVLYASYPRVWASHARGVRQQGNLFALSMITLFPQGYGDDKSPFEVPSGATFPAEFEVDADGKSVRGFGLYGILSKSITSHGGNLTVEDVADVWFKRV